MQERLANRPTATNRFHPKTPSRRKTSGFFVFVLLRLSHHIFWFGGFMVLVDFTVAERWRIFGELSFVPVRQREASAAMPRTASAVAAAQTTAIGTRTHVDPQESAARQHAQATLMQRML
jgi:hypothetical protein